MPQPINPMRNPRDYLVLANPKGVGIVSPGIGVMKNAKSKRKWDVILAYGATGAYSRFIRVELGEPLFEMQLVTDDDWAQYTLFNDFVMQVPTRNPNGKGATGYYDIDHPLCAVVGIRAVGVAAVNAPEQQEDGRWIYSVEFFEWKGAPKVTLAKPQASAAQPDPDPAYTREVNKRIAQIEDLSRK